MSTLLFAEVANARAIKAFGGSCQSTSEILTVTATAAINGLDDHDDDDDSDGAGDDNALYIL